MTGFEGISSQWQITLISRTQWNRFCLAYFLAAKNIAAATICNYMTNKKVCAIKYQKSWPTLLNNGSLQSRATCIPTGILTQAPRDVISWCAITILGIIVPLTDMLHNNGKPKQR